VTVPKDQPVRPEAGAAAPGVLDLGRVDTAFSGGAPAGGTAASSGAPAPGGTSGASSGASPGVSSSAAPGDYSIEWARPEQGRETISTPAPTVPAWVSREGLRLQVAVVFLLTADGLLRNVEVERSSGYSDVDAAVLEALRRWSFRPAPGSRDVSGRVRYSIIPR
jgi:TonB family protein